MYKKLRTHRGEAEHVNGIFAKALKESPTLGSSPARRGRQKVPPYLDVIVHNGTSDTALSGQPAFQVDRSPWQFLVALENMLRSFCLAGTFKVEDPENNGKPALMVERTLIEDHLHECRAFVLDWTNRNNRPNDAIILQQLRRVDMNIRKMWWQKFTACGTDSRQKSLQTSVFQTGVPVSHAGTKCTF